MNIPNKNKLEKEVVDKSQNQKNTEAAVYEKSKTDGKGHVYDKTTVDGLKMESEKTRDQLKMMVQDLLRRQGKAVQLLDPKTMVKIDATTRAEASKMIADDGPLGIEPMSDKIVDFAKAVSGGDKGKLDTLKKAIEKGFKEAERILGGSLPEISQKTYDRVMEKFDMWENEE